MSRPPRARYRTTNWLAYNASLKRRGSLMVWLDSELAWQAAPSRRAGRPVVFSDAAIQFWLSLKCMFGLGLRQATGLTQSLLKLTQLDWNVPDYSTLSRRQKTLSVAIAARPSRGGLHLLIDSTGVKILGEGEWKIKKARCRPSAPVAQGAPGRGCADPGDPGYRGDRQRHRGFVDAASVASAKTQHRLRSMP